MYLVYKGINKQTLKATIMKKNQNSSTCFGMQRDGPHRVVICGFLSHVSMQRDRFSCIICRCWYMLWLSQPQTLLQVIQGEKTPVT